jgi:DNA-binding CsgD family transcriptional regulator
MVSLLDHLDAIRGQDPLAQVGGLALEFVTRMVPSALGVFFVMGDGGGYTLITVKAEPIVVSDPDQIGRDYMDCIENSDPLRDLLRDSHRTSLFDARQIREVKSFKGSRLEESLFNEYGLGPGLLLAMWDETSRQHCLVFLSRLLGEAEFSEREKGFLRHVAPLLTQSYHCAIGMGGLAAPLPGTLAAELTPRELEIALLAAHGARNAEISERLNIAPGTVKCHMHNVYAKLGMTSRVHLALALGVAS